LSEAYLAEYETRAKVLDDEDYKKVEVNAVDVKEIQNTPLGVYGFWLRAMLNHSSVGRLIQEKDRQILIHLIDVQCNLHTEGFGFDLLFTFEKNDYFTNEVLKKSFVMTRQNVIEKCDGTEIAWKDGKDVTKKKIKKKSKNKKAGSKTVTKTVEQESFFNFFKTITMPAEEELEKANKTPGAEGDEEEKDVGELMDIDFELGNEFKDQLIPLALEYYLEVIEEEDEEDDDCCSDGECPSNPHGCPAKKGGDSDDEEDQPK
jgi:nucleosome assembly protein 1-like 1